MYDSVRYHRVLKKEKLKHEKKALEELEKNDPEGYQEKLEEVERQRIEVCYWGGKGQILLRRVTCERMDTED